MTPVTLSDLYAAGWAAEAAVEKGRAYCAAHPEPRWYQLLAQREQEAEVALGRYWVGRCLCVGHERNESDDLTSLLAVYLQQFPEQRALYPEVGEPMLDPAVAEAREALAATGSLLRRLEEVTA